MYNMYYVYTCMYMYYINEVVRNSSRDNATTSFMQIKQSSGIF